MLQLMLYRLSGSRLLVELIPTTKSLWGTVREGQHRRWPSTTLDDGRSERWTIELAHVRVTNIGRTPISVSEIGLDFSKGKWWSPAGS